jgi:MFS superfamily sulfate permease-like transporter
VSEERRASVVPATSAPGAAPPLSPGAPDPAADGRRLRFDRNELSGAFGDLGTDLPLIVGMVIAARLDPASVLIVYGLMQVATGLVYRMPMPVQPLKAVAALVITQRLPAATLYGGGLAIGLTMLLLSATGLLGRLARLVPKPVVRGIQAGLGLQLAGLALRDYVPSAGPAGWALAAAAFLVTLALLGNRRLPPAPFVVGLGVLFALATSADARAVWDGFGLALPALRAPTWTDVATGFVVLALPQIPLSLGNSVLATRQMAADLFPDRPPLSVRRIGLTYSAMNLVSPFLGGVPTCHGSGGMAGHYAFGGRTGGSVVIYGAFWLALGLCFSAGFAAVVGIFPLPVLGVLLLVEALALLVLLRDLAGDAGALWVALLVALVASLVPYGYLVGLVLGTVLSTKYVRQARSTASHASRGDRPS